jgi:hypothetical protein
VRGGPTGWRGLKAYLTPNGWFGGIKAQMRSLTAETSIKLGPSASSDHSLLEETVMKMALLLRGREPVLP